MKNKMNRIGLTAVFALVAVVTMMSGMPTYSSIKAGNVMGEEKHHVNLAAFYREAGQESFKFPAVVKGHDYDMLKSFEGKAHHIFLTHTAGVKAGDVITVGTDVLREGDKHFEDFGVNCQLSVNVEGEGGAHAGDDHGMKVAGMCQILMLDEKGREIEHKALVKPVEIPDISHEGEQFKLLYVNDEDGIAIYANGEEH